jgi:S-adenosylmethionine:tRNA ribosyltransferase-isomerase
MERSDVSLKTDELDYALPPELIATKPSEPRDAARMLVMSRSMPEIMHRSVRDLPEYLNAGDSLILNDTAVVPARFVGQHADTGGRIEGLFLAERSPREWQVMLRSGRPLRAGQRLVLFDRDDQPSSVGLELLAPLDDTWLVSPVGVSMDEGTASALARVGRTPLPPYILKARGSVLVDDELDRHWYQTAFADPSRQQSVAAPTAGLHFTPELLARIESRGVRIARVTLHVGPGTFKPVTVDDLSRHIMHAEQFEISATALEVIQSAHGGQLRPGRPSSRLIAVGTTVVRAIESLPDDLGAIDGGVRGETNLMIAPPYRFRRVDGMLTNFHLPRSTLLALVAAMVGLDRIKAVYREAIELRYRFYSYGDAMLILP